jgi:hypothetical protein
MLMSGGEEFIENLGQAKKAIAYHLRGTGKLTIHDR